ncbi:MAG: hypothetical protein RL134_1628 [Actinomycetota bacterium]
MRAIARSAAAVVGVGALLLGLAPAAQSVSVLPADPDRRCAWSVVYPLDANYAWPDEGAAYINQAVALGPGEKVVITGRDPKARYWSITTYNLEDRQVIDRVNDVTVKRQGKGASAPWTVTVTPRQDRKDPNSLQAAPLPRPGQAPTFKNVTVVMYRVYLSETGTYAGGQLPSVTLHHADGTQTRAERLPTCKPDQIKAPEIPLGLEPAVGVPSDAFIRAEGGRFYPSYDTAYLAAEVPYDPTRILVVSGKAPSFGKTKGAHVRYWSLCTNVNAGNLPVVDCASDADVQRQRKDGRYVIAIVGPGQVPDRSLYPGVTFLDWSKESVTDLPSAFLIMRHVLSSAKFANSIDRVKLGDRASTTMGDYAPVIEHLTVDELASR